MDYRLLCLRPWARLEIVKDWNGEKIFINPCCIDWLKEINSISIKMKDINREILNEVWNGSFYQHLRASILDNSYSLCKSTCPFYKINIDGGYEKAIEDVTQNKTLLDHGPLSFIYSANRSCNLKCKSCRNHFIVEKHNEEFSAFTSMLDKDVRTLELMGTGEVLYCKETLSFLKFFNKADYPYLKDINLITNGTLLTKNLWESLASKELIKGINVSVDAVSEETYFKIRGYDFKVLVENLKFISSLRREEKIKSFGVAFVLQQKNVKELSEFCLWARDLGVDFIIVYKLLNWGHLTELEYNDLKITDEEYNKQIILLDKFSAENPTVRIYHL
jgi:sulfatase maturation enzyme AslB (radical SAM superfamily)